MPLTRMRPEPAGPVRLCGLDIGSPDRAAGAGENRGKGSDMEVMDSLAGSIVLCNALSGDGDTSSILAEATNRDVPIADEPRITWVLVALHPSKAEVFHTWVTTSREPLDALIRARRFQRYSLRFKVVEPPSLPANDPREISICWLHSVCCANGYGGGTYFKRLLDAKYVTLGDVIDGGGRALVAMRFPGKVINGLRRALAGLGLELAPARQRRPAQREAG